MCCCVYTFSSCVAWILGTSKRGEIRARYGIRVSNHKIFWLLERLFYKKEKILILIFYFIREVHVEIVVHIYAVLAAP